MGGLSGDRRKLEVQRGKQLLSEERLTWAERAAGEEAGGRNGGEGYVGMENCKWGEPDNVGGG